MRLDEESCKMGLGKASELNYYHTEATKVTLTFCLILPLVAQLLPQRLMHPQAIATPGAVLCTRMCAVARDPRAHCQNI